MSGREHGQDRAGRDCGEDAGAYVLGALDAGEAAAFSRHLAACAICRDEVQRLRAAAERLPLSAPQLAVPGSLRRRVLRGLRDGAPDARRGATPRAVRPRPTRGGPRSGISLARLAGPVPAATLLAVALVASGATFAGVELTRSRAQPHERVVRASVASSGASAVVRVRSGRGELILRGMPAPPAGKVYEVWLAREGRPPAATSALFDVAGDGSAAVDVPGGLRGVSEVLVTPEPRGGSARPTHAPVISARLT